MVEAFRSVMVLIRWYRILIPSSECLLIAKSPMKDESIMPDFAAIYERMMRAGSKANLYFIWLRYKKEHPSGYQYTQFCYYNEYVALHYGAKNLSIVPRASPSLLVFQSELSRPTINRLQILLYEVIGHDESKYD